ncbi:WXG100 family type VII secretion target [Gordonia sp. (in: high G+C Gram-positive bacteria)]|uniref:WXG100 family type VII secretion target n=1 Tax=Gordonia sp. (in: high G+C Gram-positive bacteria) TaxID=84139 RepID=UPI0039E2A639
MYKFDDNTAQSMMGDLQNQVSRFDEQLESFQSAAAELRGHWEGEEADQYEALFARFQRGATGVRNVFADVHNALSEAGEENNKLRAGMRQAMGH